MGPKLHNVTVFLPSNEAVEDWKIETGGDLGLGGGDANTVYRVDEGLLGRRRRSFTSSLVVLQGPSPAKVTSTDHHASEGVVHTLETVMQPAKASILTTLKSDSQFNSFLALLEEHGLAEELAK